MKRAFRPVVFLVWLALLAAWAGAQGQRVLTIDAIYGVDGRVDFSGSPETSITWLDESSYLVARGSGRNTQWLRVDAATGNTSPFLDQGAMESALAALPDVTRDQASRAARSGQPTFNQSRTAVLATIGNDLYHYDFDTGRASRLTSSSRREDDPLFSPDGRWVAFTADHDLHVVDIATATERRLTTGGSDELLNGRLDWLYQEEIYGRGRFRAFWWSPDSTRLAFLQLDQRPVPTHTIVDHIPYQAGVEVMRYPKAGDPNPHVTLGIASVSEDALTWVDLSAYPENDRLVVNVGWTPDSQQVVHQVQNREQTWLDLRLADVSTGRVERVLRETTPAWVDPIGNPIWLDDLDDGGTFLWLSERSGFRHVYRYRTDGTLLGQVTSGRWSVRAFYGVDETNGRLYFAANEHSPIGIDLYRIDIDGTGLTQLSQRSGTHRAIFSPAFTQYAGVWSDVTTPAQVRLHDADGTELRVIDANPVRPLSEYRWSAPEFVEVEARDGYVLHGMLIRPSDFDPSRRYPVFQTTYAGPGAGMVRNQWGGAEYVFHQLLAQEGFVVWVLDNRSAGGRGVESQWPVYGRLGEMELQDLEDGIAWLTSEPYVDASRVVLSGWSYGGFMTAYALTHSTRWSAGIAGAPVTDWRDYDTVYTERYMRTPQNNPEGYARTAPRFAADQLEGRLLLIHGTLDDNVHVQNTVQFAYELQRAGKPFEMMLYPRSRHSIGDPWLNQHVRQLTFDFAMRAAQQVPAETAPTR